MPLPKQCLICGKELTIKCKRDIDRKKFCSHSCRMKHYHQQHIYPLPPRQTPETSNKAGKTRSERMMLGLIPKPPRVTPETSRKIGLKMRGENHWHWIADRSKVKPCGNNASYRPLIGTWRRDVLLRDEYICQICHDKNGRLIAHHIASWADFPDKRYDINNGMTVCTDCHTFIHNYTGGV